MTSGYLHREFVVLLACKHWREVDDRPTGTSMDCGGSGCRDSQGYARQRRVLKVLPVREGAPA